MCFREVTTPALSTSNHWPMLCSGYNNFLNIPLLGTILYTDLIHRYHLVPHFNTLFTDWQRLVSPQCLSFFFLYITYIWLELLLYYYIKKGVILVLASLNTTAIYPCHFLKACWSLSAAFLVTHLSARSMLLSQSFFSNWLTVNLEKEKIYMSKDCRAPFQG